MPSYHCDRPYLPHAANFLANFLYFFNCNTSDSTNKAFNSMVKIEIKRMAAQGLEPRGYLFALPCCAKIRMLQKRSAGR